MITVRKPKNALIFKKPSSWWGSSWRTALPIGNGIIGASIEGGAGEDVLMLTHADLWWQGKDSVLQDVSDRLKDVRKKLDDRDVADAASLMSNDLIRKNFRPQVAYPLPLADFNIEMPLEKMPKEYARVLNMENGEATVTYKDGATRYERSCFVSRERNIIVYEITRVGQKLIDATFSFGLHEKFNARTKTGISAVPDGVNIKCENFFIYYSARSNNGTDFGAVAKINFFSGRQQVDEHSITIHGAEKVLVTIMPFVESQREKAWKNARALLGENKLTYDKLLKEHTTLHQRAFAGSDFDLAADNRDKPIDDLLDTSFTTGEIPSALLEKLWAFGRYLFISGTSPQSRAIAPYGLWCGDFKAQSAQIDASGSLENMYAQSLTGNLTEYMESVFRMYETVFDDLRKNASRLFGCRGIFVPSVMSPSTGVLGKVEDAVVNFTAAAGYVSRMFYDYYLFTGDKKFLKDRALPFMKENMNFYEEFFKLVGPYYEASPSYSPGTTPGNIASTGEFAIARNATVDFAVARDLLENIIKAGEETAQYKSEIVKWKEMLLKIPPYKVTDDGAVSEFIDDYFTDNPSATSCAMFYPVYPGTEITPDNEFFKAFSNAAKKKYNTARANQTAASLSTYANIFARLGDAQSAIDAISALVTGFAMENLVTASSDWRGMGIGKREIWATPCIEGNLAITSALQEMVVSSAENVIKLLPALPSSMAKGSVANFATRTGADISLDWDMQRGVLSVKLRARKQTKLDLWLPRGFKPPKKVDGTFDAERSRLTDLSLPANKVVSLEFRG